MCRRGDAQGVPETCTSNAGVQVLHTSVHSARRAAAQRRARGVPVVAARPEQPDADAALRGGVFWQRDR